MRLVLSVLSVSLGFISCSTVQIREPAASVLNLSPEEAWAQVLKEHVDDRGRVNFRAVLKNPEKLDRYVSYVTQKAPWSHPDEFKSREAKLAYYINSYNALSMYNIIDGGIPDTLAGLKKVKYFFLKKFRIGGEIMSLYKYENEIIRKMDEERVHFALNCMSAGCPRLPREPFRAETLNAVLDAQAKEFFSEQRNLRVDVAEKVVHLSEILSFFTEDFLKKAPSLIAYVNKYRSEKIPEDYKVKFIPYDWTINAQPLDAKSLTKKSQSKSAS